uniref:Reverse transcriptase domain-containing protein n=1 Tax=Tanacetum cinerariifolium TaxID=118510 RepID=A0A699I613_TANCI|nr:reverse transcriptase domain-containing protein [Tanacetum cinerariifolium]
MLSNPEVAGRLLKWRFELEEHNIHYRLRTSIKGQILAEFIVELLNDDPLDTPIEDKEELSDPWILFTDGSSCIDGSGAGLIITNPKGTELTYALRFRFNATNNEAEYEALIAGLRIAKQMGVKNLQANVDSRLVANQVNGTYVAKEPGMIKYLEKFKNLASTFKEFSIKQNKFYQKKRKNKGCTPQGKEVCRDKWSFVQKVFLGPWLRCVRPLHANYVLRELHEGSCSMHADPRSVVAKALRSGVYNTSFKLGDLVYRSNEASHAKDGGKLRPKWEGPYEVTKSLGKGAYRLRDRSGNHLPRRWNVCNLKKFYVHAMEAPLPRKTSHGRGTT